MKTQKNEITIHSSAAEYLTFVAATGDSTDSIEVRYEDENIWLTQKMMAQLCDVSVAAINQHLKTIFNDGELEKNSVSEKIQRHFQSLLHVQAVLAPASLNLHQTPL